jgi:hypothetical protein
MRLSPHPSLLLAVLLVAAPLTSCGGSAQMAEIDADGRTHYRSGAVPLQPDMRRTGLATVNEMSVRASASCVGEGCRPESVTVALVNQSGAYMETTFRNVELIVDGASQEWEEAAFRDPQRPTARAGEFIQIEMSPTLFRRMAYGNDVRLQLGTRTYRLVHNRRATLREMAAAMGLN